MESEKDSPKLMTVKEAKKRLSYVLKEFVRVEKRLNNLMNLYFNRLDEKTPIYVKRLNLLDILSKLLEINSRFLKTFVDTYGIDEPVLSTALARGIFELHLILLEATSSDEGFVRILEGGGDAYESYIQMFRQIAKEKRDALAIKIFDRELERIHLHRKRFEELLKVNLKDGAKLKLYVRFKELANKHGLSDVYDFEYKLLSFFIHPTFLYITTTITRDKTISNQKRRLNVLNVEHRKRMVKSMATNIAFGISSRTITHIEKILDDFKL